ncbi:uncharacterized [Tachysurus ichikawai]
MLLKEERNSSGEKKEEEKVWVKQVMFNPPPLLWREQESAALPRSLYVSFTAGISHFNEHPISTGSANTIGSCADTALTANTTLTCATAGRFKTHKKKIRTKKNK